MTRTQERKKKAGICISPRCKKKAAKNNNYCHSCRMKRWAKDNPEKYKWSVLKNNAKRRGKEFDLSFEDFMVFLKRNPDYMRRCGTTVRSLHIDRIDVTKGYTLDNIQAITLAQNVRKQHDIDYPF